MNILQEDIQRYEGYLEFTMDGLRHCHPNDEDRLKKIVSAYKNIIGAMENLDNLKKILSGE